MSNNKKKLDYLKKNFPKANINNINLDNIDINVLDEINKKLYVVPVLKHNQQYEYSVILHNFEDSNEFYNDMENNNLKDHIPNRIVQCTNRKLISKATIYKLTPDEAETLKQDSRVEDVHLTSKELGTSFKPFQYSSNWDKSTTVASNMLNWGLLRMANRSQITNWGSDGTANMSGTVTLTSSGRNVDVVIADGHINKFHPEFAVNADGSGGSRVQQFNWFSLTSQVTGGSNGTYDYSQGTTDNNAHGTHVAGISCGNTCGWARNANIYNIYPYGDYTGAITTENLIDYIRVWHDQKSINPITGRKNPTIVNMSFGYSEYCASKDIASVTYRGSTTSKPTSAENTQNPRGYYDQLYNDTWGIDHLTNLGLQADPNLLNDYNIFIVYFALRNNTFDTDIFTAVDDGIIFVSAAGNSMGLKCDVIGGNDYNNTLTTSSTAYDANDPNNIASPGINSQTFYYNRGSSPAGAQTGSAWGASDYKEILAVGNISTVVSEQIAYTSNSGKKINIWAPGDNVMSSWIQTSGDGSVADSRNSSYYLMKESGTSMASPQITGILACALEQYPNMNQKLAITYVQTLANTNAIPDPKTSLLSTTALPANKNDGIAAPGHLQNYYNLNDASNKFATYYPDRPVNGNTFPQKRYWLRPTSGGIYPRQTIRRYPIG